MKRRGEGSTPNPFTWNGAYGYEFIPFTGLYHVGAREYDPRTARWLQRDPIDISGGEPNLYVYSSNDPVNGADPEGLRDLTPTDKARLRKLYRYSVSQGGSIPDKTVNAAIREIKKAIASVPKGASDPTNLKALWWAIDQLGDTRWGRSGTVRTRLRTFGPGTNKCNIFVGEAYATGAGIGYGGSKGYPITRTWRGNVYPVPADLLADPSRAVKNFIVEKTPELGDIIAYPGDHFLWFQVGSGHATLYCGAGLVIYAGGNDAKLNTIADLTKRLGKSHTAIRRYRP